MKRSLILLLSIYGLCFFCSIAGAYDDLLNNEYGAVYPKGRLVGNVCFNYMKSDNRFDVDGEKQELTDDSTDLCYNGEDSDAKWKPGLGMYTVHGVEYIFTEALRGNIGLQYMYIGDGQSDGKNVDDSAENWLELTIGGRYTFSDQFRSLVKNPTRLSYQQSAISLQLNNQYQVKL